MDSKFIDILPIITIFRLLLV